ncbi:MAG TPA: DUF1080 domain-containing protein [Planctomycetota bacterium]|nr:DUF1080 domain-containing protein [Planctomycetota bacterium]
MRTRHWCAIALLSAACSTGAPAPKEAQRDPTPEWRTLFDGKTLDGWVTKGGHYDGSAAWSVEDGALTGRVNEKGEGGLIYTAEPYSAFDFACDTRMDFPFDSGIFVRMAPEGRGAQVTLDHRSDGEIAAIYSDAFLAHNETAKAKFKKDDWNHVEVRCTGFDMHLVVWLNGELVTEYQVPTGTSGFAPRGLIGLQVHGDRDDPKSNKVQFKNIRVRERAIFDDALFAPTKNGLLQITPEGARQGWNSLTAGNDLSRAWSPTPAEGYALDDGVLCVPAKGSGHIASKEDYADFQLRIDFKIARMANSGLYLRSTRTSDNPSFTGAEVQILDDFDWEKETKTTLLPYQSTGGLYGSVPAGWKRYRPIGEWNTYEVLYAGNRLAVALNGLTLYDVDVTTVPVGEHPPFAARAKSGFIGFQQYGAPLVTDPYSAWFRNVFVRKL